MNFKEEMTKYTCCIITTSLTDQDVRAFRDIRVAYSLQLILSEMVAVSI